MTIIRNMNIYIYNDIIANMSFFLEIYKILKYNYVKYQKNSMY